MKNCVNLNFVFNLYQALVIQSLWLWLRRGPAQFVDNVEIVLNNVEKFIDNVETLVDNVETFVESLTMLKRLREAILQKIPEFYEILSKNGDPPPYCF